MTCPSNLESSRRMSGLQETSLKVTGPDDFRIFLIRRLSLSRTSVGVNVPLPGIDPFPGDPIAQRPCLLTVNQPHSRDGTRVSSGVGSAAYSKAKALGSLMMHLRFKMSTVASCTVSHCCRRQSCCLTRDNDWLGN